VATDSWLSRVALCYKAPRAFFQYLYIEDPVARDWIPFSLWPAQEEALEALHRHQRIVILKARQLGLTWLCLGYALWTMIFRPIATVLLFSRRETEARYLLCDRLKPMFAHLPDWMRQGLTVEEDNATEWALSNGSTARAFPTTAGDSYSATFALVDEADLVPDLGALLRAVKPTVDAGGKLVLLSRVNKATPNSVFQLTYRAAETGENGWAPLFLPWRAHPGRDEAWYEAQKRDVLARTGSLDDLYEQYPATVAEALAPRSLDKRIPPDWLLHCYAAEKPMEAYAGPAISGLRVYECPVPGERYVVGVDPAEGNPTSDDSAIYVLNARTKAEAANLAAHFEPAVTAAYAEEIARWYNGAPIMVERNNHGHAVLLALRERGRSTLLPGEDGRPGWATTPTSKALLWSRVAEAFRDGLATVRDADTFAQLSSIDGATLSAPPGEHDDRAMAYALALVASLRAISLPKITSVIRRN
jgi:hypothetical protein